MGGGIFRTSNSSQASQDESSDFDVLKPER